LVREHRISLNHFGSSAQPIISNLTRLCLKGNVTG
jgi:hypothetical protein